MSPRITNARIPQYVVEQIIVWKKKMLDGSFDIRDRAYAQWAEDNAEFVLDAEYSEHLAEILADLNKS